MTKAEMLNTVRLEIAEALDKIDREIIRDWSLNLPRLTLIARDPDVPGMVICVSNEPDDAGLQGAFEQVKGAARV